MDSLPQYILLRQIYLYVAFYRIRASEIGQGADCRTILFWIEYYFVTLSLSPPSHFLIWSLACAGYLCLTAGWLCVHNKSYQSPRTLIKINHHSHQSLQTNWNI